MVTQASLHKMLGFKGKKGASLPPPPEEGEGLDMGAGMGMGSLDLPSFDDLDAFGLTLQKKEEKKDDFKALLPKVRMRDPSKDTGNASFSLALAPPPPSGPVAMIDDSDDDFEMEFQCAQINPFPTTMYPSVYAALQFVAPATTATPSGIIKATSAPFDSAISLRDDEELPDLPSMDELDRMGAEASSRRASALSDIDAAESLCSQSQSARPQAQNTNPFPTTMYDAVYEALQFEPVFAADVDLDIDSDMELGMHGAGDEEGMIDSDLEMGDRKSVV